MELILIEENIGMKFSMHIGVFNGYYYFPLNCSSAKEEQFHKQTKSFFLELVSSLCFSHDTPPEPELMRLLLDIVFDEKKETEKLTCSSMTERDTVPVIRVFLLQLLLEKE